MRTKHGAALALGFVLGGAGCQHPPCDPLPVASWPGGETVVEAIADAEAEADRHHAGYLLVAECGRYTWVMREDELSSESVWFEGDSVVAAKTGSEYGCARYGGKPPSCPDWCVVSLACSDDVQDCERAPELPACESSVRR